MGGHHLPRTGRTGLGGDGESSPGGGRGILQGLRGAIIFQEPGAPAWGGTGSPAQGVVGASFKAYGGPSSSKNRALRPGGDGESSPGGGRGILQGLWGAIIFQEPGAPAWGGTGSPAQGVVGASCKAHGGGHQLRRTGRTGLGGTGSPAQGVVGASCKAYGGGHQLRRTGRTGLGGTGSPAQGVVGASCKARGEPSSSKNRAHRPGGNGESSLGGGRSSLQGPWGGVIFGEPGTPAWGGRGGSSQGGGRSLLRGPRGGVVSHEPGSPARGGTGSPARGVIGAFFRDGRRALRGRWGGSRLVGAVPPAWGGWSPARGRAVTGGRLQGGGMSSGARAPVGGSVDRSLLVAAAMFPEGYPVPLRRRAAPPAGPRAGSSGRKAVLTPRLSESCDRVAPHP